VKFLVFHNDFKLALKGNIPSKIDFINFIDNFAKLSGDVLVLTADWIGG